MDDCIIGLYHKCDSSELVTLEDLKCHIAESKAFNFECDKVGYHTFKLREYTLKEYADKRRSTNLTRFTYCPMCGKKINWKGIGSVDNGKQELPY